MSVTKANSDAPFIVFSDDPEVMIMQGMIKGMAHFDQRGLTMRHLKMVLAVELCHNVTGQHPRVIDIAAYSQLKDFESELFDMVEKRYLHELVPLYGEFRYKLGPMGGTLLRQVLDRKPKKPKLKAVK